MIRALPVVLLACLGLAAGAPMTTAAAGTAPATSAAKKRGCATKKTKSARTACTRARRTMKLRKGMVCSLSRTKQLQYRRAGFVCIDVSARQDGTLTFLEDL